MLKNGSTVWLRVAWLPQYPPKKSRKISPRTEPFPRTSSPPNVDGMPDVTKDWNDEMAAVAVSIGREFH